jgi:hypothetical protein
MHTLISSQTNRFLVFEVSTYPLFVAVKVEAFLTEEDGNIRRARLSKEEVPVVVTTC